MKNILLSADGPVRVYSVPDEVATDICEWADRFRDWLHTAPEAAPHRFQTKYGVGLRFTEADFIAYLNTVAFPAQRSCLVEELGFINPRNAPEPICSYEWYNF